MLSPGNFILLKLFIRYESAVTSSLVFILRFNLTPYSLIIKIGFIF
nr:MAG TPA: hypothetical protein [Bacteriophage sp.]